ncbi:MAG: alpha/beta hydrolase [Bryobacterales bacterium]|nr:alpha/beta hydrolase [Bryobacterales bacterium]
MRLLTMFRLAFPLLSAVALLQAQDGAVPCEGFSLHYRSEGAGTPIIFLSGGPGFDVDYFIPAARLFPAGYRHIFLEQRGTGRSRPATLAPEMMTVAKMVADLEALRIHLKLDRLLLAGHSWGGMLAMAYAAAHPNHVDRLILIGSGGHTMKFIEWFLKNIEARLHAEDREARDYWTAAVKRGVSLDKAMSESIAAIVPAYFFDRGKGLAFAASMADGAFHSDSYIPLFTQDAVRNYDLRASLATFSRPTLILHGHQDPIGDKTAEDIHALIRSSTLRYINECGHFPWLEQPGQMRAIVSEFLGAK